MQNFFVLKIEVSERTLSFFVALHAGF